MLQGPDDDIRKPQLATKMGWEVEFGIVIGSRTRYVSKDKALDHVAGYMVCDDLCPSVPSRARPAWDRGKSCETFGPAGPRLVTRDEVGEVQALGVWLDVNGRRMQTGSTQTMIFDCPTLVSYFGEFRVLWPGDIITTGTPRASAWG